MGFTSFSSGSADDDPEKVSKGMREMLGPHAVDDAIRQAINICWMVLPESRKNVASVEAEIRRTVDRALKNLKDDASAFGLPRE